MNPMFLPWGVVVAVFLGGAVLAGPLDATTPTFFFIDCFVDPTGNPLEVRLHVAGDLPERPWRIAWGDGKATPLWAPHDRLRDYRHTYEAGGHYDVALEFPAPEADPLAPSLTCSSAVHVSTPDPSSLPRARLLESLLLLTAFGLGAFLLHRRDRSKGPESLDAS